MFPFFTDSQLSPLFFAAFFLISSVIVFQTDKIKLSLLLLFTGSLVLGYFMAHLDPFLRVWDEQFHALVAKNMMKNPLKPTLYAEPVIHYDYRSWSDNHVWLHKQPLFLWQIALSLKVFGINEMAVRIPGIIMHAVAALMVYRIGKISCNKSVGFYAALFFTVSAYTLELLTGYYATDHNDVAFLFYITASFWGWFEYQYSHKKYWIVLIGVFVGCAVLVKWLVGLLIYAVWFITLGADDKKAWLHYKNYLPIIRSFLVSLVVFLPWQVYILLRFPKEASYEYAFNTRHFFEVIENHGGDFWFHFNEIQSIYGSGIAVPFLLLAGLVFLFKNAVSRKYSIAIISAIFIVYLFYSLAATKMPSFSIIVSPLVYIGMAAFIDVVFKFIHSFFKQKTFGKIVNSGLLITICFLLLDLNKIEMNHTSRGDKAIQRMNDVKEMKLISHLKNTLGKGKYVVFKTSSREFNYVPLMFYTDYIAYQYIPYPDVIKEVKAKNKYRIVVIDNGKLPEYITTDKDILVIKNEF